MLKNLRATCLLCEIYFYSFAIMNWAKYKQQNVEAVDMCAAIVCAHRVKNLPIKAIHMKPRYYGDFKSWLQKELKREILDEEKMQLDDVNLELGTPTQATNFLIEMWDSEYNIAAHTRDILRRNVN